MGAKHSLLQKKVGDFPPSILKEIKTFWRGSQVYLKLGHRMVKKSHTFWILETPPVSSLPELSPVSPSYPATGPLHMPEYSCLTY